MDSGLVLDIAGSASLSREVFSMTMGPHGLQTSCSLVCRGGN